MRTVLSLIGWMLPLSLLAQNPTNKLVLKKGDILKINTTMDTKSTMSMMGGDPMESSINSNTYTELEVKDQQDTIYILSQTLKTMSMKFDGFGQSIEYDSKKDGKSDNMFLKTMTEKIDQPEEVRISHLGKVIPDPVKEEKDKKEAKGGGMMRMMGSGGSGAIAETCFLIIPAEAFPNGTWETSTEQDGLKTRKRYTLSALMGPIATVTVQSQTKGQITMDRGGMSMTTDVNTVSEEMMMVDIQNGRVSMHTVTMTNNSKTLMAGQESPSTGKTSITTTIE